MPKTSSLASSVASLPEKERKRLIQKLSPKEAEALIHDWWFWARPNQTVPEGDWRIWLILAGRGWGKTRTGAQAVRWAVTSGKYGYIALIAPTAADVRDVLVEGESGILASSAPWDRPTYEPSKRRLTWPNGAMATTFSADEPDRLRGPQHDFVLGDELAAWRYPETWDMMLMGLRLGRDPRAVATTTPRPVPLIKGLLDDPTVYVTRGSTYENRANLAPAFLKEIASKYEGTRLGRQELYAEILDDNPGALWHREWLDKGRLKQLPELSRVVVGVDPSASSGEDSAETGIVVAGCAKQGDVMHGYVLDDLSIRGTPREWAISAVAAYYKHRADLIAAEINQGGEMVESVIRTVDPNVPVKCIRASRGKQVRAEPVSALYEQGRVHHIGYFRDLESQLCEWVPGATSPDRLDALVHAMTELVLEAPSSFDAWSEAARRMIEAKQQGQKP